MLKGIATMSIFCYNSSFQPHYLLKLLPEPTLFAALVGLDVATIMLF
jgi:hypothetical protein